jgi:hypothetical protein
MIIGILGLCLGLYGLIWIVAKSIRDIDSTENEGW